MLYDGPDDGQQLANSSCGRGIATIISFVVLTRLKQAHMLKGIRSKAPNLEIRLEYCTLKHIIKRTLSQEFNCWICTLIQHTYYNKDLSVKRSTSKRCYPNFILCDHALLFLSGFSYHSSLKIDEIWPQILRGKISPVKHPRNLSQSRNLLFCLKSETFAPVENTSLLVFPRCNACLDFFQLYVINIFSIFKIAVIFIINRF